MSLLTQEDLGRSSDFLWVTSHGYRVGIGLYQPQ